MRESKFTLNECIKILDNIEIIWGVKKNGSLSVRDFNLAVVKTTGRTHPNFIQQMMDSFVLFGCIELNQKKNIVTILLDEGDLK